MVHEDREEGQALVEAQRRRVVLVVLGELGDKADEVAVEPAQHVEHGHRLGLEGTQPRDEHGGGLLVERLRELLEVRRVLDLVGDGAHPQVRLARRVQEPCGELYEAVVAGRGERRRGLVDLVLGQRVRVEVDRERRCVVHCGRDPLARVAHAHLRVGHARGLLHAARAGPDRAHDLPVRRRLHLERRVEGHLEEAVAVLRKVPEQGAVEVGLLPAVSHEQRAAGVLHAVLQLRDPGLVEARREDVEHVAVHHHLLHDVVVEGRGRGEVLGWRCIVPDVGVPADQVLFHEVARLTGAFAAHTAHERHDAGGDIGEQHLEHRGRDGDGRTGAAHRAVVLGHGPQIHLDLVDERREQELGVAQGRREAVAALGEVELLLNGRRRDLPAASERVAAAQRSVGVYLVQLHRRSVRDEADVGVLGQVVEAEQKLFLERF
eukprot:PhM_4_TR456/c0_g1_i3/m.31211